MDAIFLSILISTTLLSGIFLIIWLKIDRKPHVLCWALTFFFAVINILLNASRDLFPNRDVYWVIVNTSSYLVQFSAVAGFFYRSNINPFRFSLVGYFVVIEILLIILTIYDIHFGLRVGLTSLSGVLMHIAIIWVVNQVDRPLRVPEKGLVIVYGLFSMTQLVAGISAVMQGYFIDEYFLGIYRQINFLFLPPAFIGTGMFAIMIIADDLAIRIQSQLLHIKSTNQDLKKEKIKAEQATQAKTHFLANISHEIRTPMNAVLGMSYLTLKTSLDSKQQNYVENIHSAAEGLLGVINDVLILSKIEAGAMSVVKQNFSPKELLQSCTDVVQNLANEKKLTLSINIDENLPVKVRTDQGKLKQILINLINNAVKFTTDGSVTVNCKTLQQKDNQVLINFSIEDTGIGIAPEHLDRVCKAFSQIDDSRTRDYEGTGLGLNITSKLIKFLGGQLIPKSQLNKGSQFSFSLWMENIELENERKLSQPVKPINDENKIASASVLIADDHETNLLLLKELLEQVHMTVCEAKNGEEAFNLCNTNQFDIVILDINMPKSDGYSTTKKIRELSNYHQVPIIAVTANAFDTDEEKALKAGMTSYMSKPLQPYKLYRLLATWCVIEPSFQVSPESPNEFAVQHKNTHSSNTRLLKGFLQDHHDDMNQLVLAVNSQDHRLWQNTLHGLLGCSGNIKAHDLHDQIKKLQHKSQNFNIICTIPDELVTQFQSTLEQVTLQINQHASDEHQVDVLSDSQLLEVLSLLAPKLTNRSFDLEKELSILNRPVSPSLQPLVKALVSHLEAFDYPAAITISSEIQSHLK